MAVATKLRVLSRGEKKWLHDIEKSLKITDRKLASSLVTKIHKKHMMRWKRDFQRKVPESDSKGGPGQPEVHLKAGVRVRKLRKSKNAMGVTVVGAFHYNFMEYGTKIRKGGRGQIKGFYKNPSSPSGWNRTGFGRDWSRRVAEEMAPKLLEEYAEKLIMPGLNNMSQVYRWRLQFTLPTMIK
jgi:hypothetical protein